MKRLVWLGVVILLLAGGVFAYYQYGGSPEARRDKYLKLGREYLAQSKFNEAVVVLRNAVKADPRSVEARLELGQALMKSGNLRAAYSELVRAVDLKPDSLQGRYRLALFQLGIGDLKGAKENYEKTRAADRDALETRTLAAKIALAEKQPDKAILELAEVLKKDPKNVGIHVDLGLIYFGKKDFKTAETYFLKALELDSKAANARVALAQLYLASGDQEKGEQQLVLGTKADPENEALLHVLGLFYSITKQSSDFEKLYLDILKKKPDSLIAKKRLAEFYLVSGHVPQARRYTDEILKIEPGDIDGHFFRGRLNLAEGSFVKAIEDLTAVTQSAPRLGPAFYFLGQAQRAANRTEEARKNLARAVELNPNWVLPRFALAQLYVGKGDADLALEQSDGLLRALPKNENLLLLSGAARLKKGETDKALALFKKAAEVNPKSTAARMNIAALYALQKKPAEAIKEYYQVLAIDRNRVEALSAIIQLYIAEGKPKVALEEAEKYASKTNDPAVVQQMIGQINLVMKDFPKAIEHLSKAIELNPNLTSAYLLLGNTYAAEKKNDAAIEQYQKILTKNPRAVAALMMVGLLYDRKREKTKANEYYQKVLELNKAHTLAANNLAYNYAQDGGNLDIALRIAQKARESNPNDPSLADTLGWIYYKKGTYLSALELLKESNEKFKSSNPEVLYHLGMTYYKSGNKSSAAQALSDAVARNKQFNGREEANRVLQELQPKSRQASAS